jgi:hypothetical protein
VISTAISRLMIASTRRPSEPRTLSLEWQWGHEEGSHDERGTCNEMDFRPVHLQQDLPHGTVGNTKFQHADSTTMDARISITNVADTDAVVTVVTVSSSRVRSGSILGGNGELTIQPGDTGGPFTVRAVDGETLIVVSVRIDSTQPVVPGGEVRFAHRITQHQEEVFDGVISVAQLNWYTLPSIPPRPPVQEVVGSLDASVARN